MPGGDASGICYYERRLGIHPDWCRIEPVNFGARDASSRTLNAKDYWCSDIASRVALQRRNLCRHDHLDGAALHQRGAWGERGCGTGAWFWPTAENQNR